MEIKTILKMREEENNDNYLNVQLPAISKNEKLSRNIVASFLLELNPSVESLNDIKTAVSEAVTNSVVHGYKDNTGECRLTLKIKDKLFYIRIEDFGVGIENIEEAMQPFFTTGNTGDRSGMGFTVMETFMNKVEVTKNGSRGVKIQMIKNFVEARKIVGE